MVKSKQCAHIHKTSKNLKCYKKIKKYLKNSKPRISFYAKNGKYNIQDLLQAGREKSLNKEFHH